MAKAATFVILGYYLLFADPLMPQQLSKTTLRCFMFAAFLDFLGIFMMAPVLMPVLLDENSVLYQNMWGSNYTTIVMGLVFSAYGIGQYFGSPFFGSLADKAHIKPYFLISYAGMMLGYCIGGLGFFFLFWPLFIVTRFSIGFFSGSISMIYSMIGRYLEGSEKQKIMGYITGCMSIGATIGPVVGGYIAHLSVSSPMHMEWAFYLVASFFLFITLFFFWKLTLPTQEDTSTGKSNIFSKMLSAYRACGNSIALKRAVMMYLAFIMAAIAINNIFPMYAVEVFAVNGSWLGLAYSMISIGGAIGSFMINPRLSKKYSPEQILPYSLTPYIIALSTVYFCPTPTYIVINLFVIGLCSNVCWSQLLSLISHLSPKRDSGKIMGATQSMLSLAVFVMPTTVGIIAKFNPSYGLAFVTLLAVTALVMRLCNDFSSEKIH